MTEGNEEKRKPGRPRKEKPTTSFAYGTFDIVKDTSHEDRNQMLSKYGALGWEIVSVVGNYNGTHTVYMMKEIK